MWMRRECPPSQFIPLCSTLQRPPMSNEKASRCDAAWFGIENYTMYGALYVRACMCITFNSLSISWQIYRNRSQKEWVPKSLLESSQFYKLGAYHRYSAFSMCLHRRLDSVLASVGTLLRLYCLNIAYLREINFRRPLDEFKPKTPGQDCFLLTPRYQHSFLVAPLQHVEDLIINRKEPSITQHSKRSTIASSRAIKMNGEYKESSGHLSNPHPEPGQHPPAVVSGMFWSMAMYCLSIFVRSPLVWFFN